MTEPLDSRVCIHCKKPLERRDGERPNEFAKRVACDKACANRYKNDQIRGKPNPKLRGANNGMWGKTHTPEAREKQRQAALSYQLTPEQQAKAAAARVGQKRSMETRARMAVARRRYWENASPEQRAKAKQRFLNRMPMRPCFRKTSIERAMARLLEEHGIAYEWNKPLLDRFCVDFLLTNHNVVVECDGEYWHSLPETVVRDAAKNELIPAAGYSLLRFSETEIRLSPETCLQRIMDSLR